MMQAELFTVPEYSMRYVKERILEFRRKNGYAGSLEVKFPLEAENAIGFLKQHYPSSVSFSISVEVADKQVIIRPNGN